MLAVPQPPPASPPPLVPASDTEAALANLSSARDLNATEVVIELFDTMSDLLAPPAAAGRLTGAVCAAGSDTALTLLSSKGGAALNASTGAAEAATALSQLLACGQTLGTASVAGDDAGAPAESTGAKLSTGIEALGRAVLNGLQPSSTAAVTVAVESDNGALHLAATAVGESSGRLSEPFECEAGRAADGLQTAAVVLPPAVAALAIDQVMLFTSTENIHADESDDVAAGPVLSVQLFRNGSEAEVSALPEPVNLTLPIAARVQQQVQQGATCLGAAQSQDACDAVLSCFWWDASDWSAEGCETRPPAGANATAVVCACDHLTMFVTLLTPRSGSDVASAFSVNRFSLAEAFECLESPTWQDFPCLMSAELGRAPPEALT